MFVIIVRMKRKNGHPFCELFFNKSDNLLFLVWICYTYAMKS